MKSFRAWFNLGFFASSIPGYCSTNPQRRSSMGFLAFREEAASSFAHSSHMRSSSAKAIKRVWM